MTAEVAVLGGGIAGAAACLRLIQRGVRPLWLMRAHQPGDVPGESLSPAARTVLSDLGALALLDDHRHRPANSVFSAWGSDRLHERSSVVHLEGPALVLDRPAFEAALRDKAIAGADVVDTQMVECRRTPSGWAMTADGEAHVARLVIDATGRNAVVARQHAQRFRADKLAALLAFLPQIATSDVDPTPATLIEAVADGWWYASLLADGRLALNFFSDSDVMPEAARRDVTAFAALLGRTTFVGRWIAEAGFEITAPPALASAATTWMAPCAGADWLAAGDAAAAFDPLSSHGMTTALWTGTRSADAAMAMLDGDAQAPAAYAADVMRGVQDFLSGQADMYRREIRFAEHPFWARRLREVRQGHETETGLQTAG